MDRKGKSVLPQFIEGAKGNFNLPYSTDLTDQQKVIVNALWRANTPTKKVEALNSLCYHFHHNKVEKTDYNYFVIFEGTKAGVYETWAELQKAVGKKNTPRGWKGYFSMESAMYAYTKYRATGKNPAKIMEEHDPGSQSTFGKFSQEMNLKVKTRKQWLNKLPEEIKRKIISITLEKFYFDLGILQEILADLNEQGITGLETVQWSGPQHHNPYCPPILLGKIDWSELRIKPLVNDLFHNGMLLLLRIPENTDIPDFFGPRLQECFRAFSRGKAFFLHFISEIPKMNNEGDFFPATHNIFLSRAEPRWFYYRWNEYDFTNFCEHQWFSAYSPNFKGPDDEWELLTETITAKVWVLHGIAIMSRSHGPIPGRKNEGWNIDIQPINLQEELANDNMAETD